MTVDGVFLLSKYSCPFLANDKLNSFLRYQIMMKCWEENPKDRPTFAKLKEMMKDMERNHRVVSRAIYVQFYEFN